MNRWQLGMSSIDFIIAAARALAAEAAALAYRPGRRAAVARRAALRAMVAAARGERAALRAWRAFVSSERAERRRKLEVEAARDRRMNKGRRYCANCRLSFISLDS